MQKTSISFANYGKMKNKNPTKPSPNHPPLKMKKAQIKIQQTAFMLIALTLFFVLVGLFLISFKMSDLKQKANALDEKNAVILASKIAASPELSCGHAYGETRVNCIDSDKLIVFIGSSSKYKNFWQISNLEIRKIYPSQTQEIICTQNNYPDCNYFKIYANSTKNSGPDYTSFGVLCRKDKQNGVTYNKCELAKLIVSYNVK